MPNENRKLASIQRISTIKPIEGADRIELATVKAWQVIVRKDEFKEGDLVVYFEVDSFLPLREEWSFLEKTSKRRNKILDKEGIHIKTIKLRGEISQGLILPISLLPELGEPIASLEKSEGCDVTGILGVSLWEEPEIANGDETIRTGYYPGLRKTDELRIQSYPEMHSLLLRKPYYITEKIDGQSLTITYRKNEGVRIFTRNSEVLESETSPIWNYFKKKGHIQDLIDSKRDVYFQGELFGPKIQGNRLKLKELDWKWFNVGVLREETKPTPHQDQVPYYIWDVFFISLLPTFKEQHVPVIESGSSFNYSIEELIELASGKSVISNQNREGIVVRTQDNQVVYDRKPLSFKVISNKYLLKYNL